MRSLVFTDRVLGSRTGDSVLHFFPSPLLAMTKIPRSTEENEREMVRANPMLQPCVPAACGEEEKWCDCAGSL